MRRTPEEQRAWGHVLKPAHAVMLEDCAGKHGANPWPVEFFFDEVWVSDSADATHEEHLIGGGEIDGDGELLVANRWRA